MENNGKPDRQVAPGAGYNFQCRRRVSQCGMRLPTLRARVRGR